jgi:hypothetical protein
MASPRAARAFAPQRFARPSRHGAFALAAVVAGALAAPPARGGDGESAGWLGRLDRGTGRLLAPGPLAEAHAHLEGATDCGACHSRWSGVPDRDCLACHENVDERMRSGTGVHGGFEGECRSCHPEHLGRDAPLRGLDRAAFNHESARFALRGAHAGVACEACHLRTDPETGREVFHGFPLAFARCGDCHADPHAEGFARGRDCGVCHGEAGFSASFAPDAPAGFDHAADAGFPLEGRHAAVACEGCHGPERWTAGRRASLPPGRGVPRDCAGCHEDPHAKALGSRCTTCHDARAWKGPDATFDHARHTDFALDAAHARLACGACHADQRFTAPARDCAGCHPVAADLLAGRYAGASVPPDPHAGRVECAACHPADAPGARLRELERACVGCHAPEYAPLLVTQRRALDALLVRAEGALRGAELAARRGEAVASPAPPDAARRVRDLGASGLHHPALAEALLRELVAPGPVEPGSGSR